VKTANHDTNEGLRYLASFAGLVTSLTSRFVILRPDELDDGISNTLKEIGEFAEVDRSYVFLFSEDGDRVSYTHEWCAAGVESAIDNIQDTPVEEFEWALLPIKRGDVLYVESVAKLPPEAAKVKAELERQHILSMINLPLICSGNVLGFVGFDSVHHAMSWTDEHIKLLKVVGEIIAGAIDRRRATIALQRQVEMENLIAQISTRFINVPVAQLEKEIHRAISVIGKFTGVDRSYIFRLENEGCSMSNTDEWCGEGIEPHIDRLQSLPVDVFEYSMERMHKGEVLYVADVGRLPPEAEAEKAEFEAEDIKTLINVPIMLRSEMIGFLGFDAVRKRKVWSSDDIRLLKLVSEIFANAFDRASIEKQLQTSISEKEVLLKEVHHRVKNNLQIISGLLYLQANAVRDRVDDVALDAFAESQSRIKAMATIHDRLYQSQDLSGIDFGGYLHVLAPEILSFFAKDKQVEINVDAESLYMPIDQAIPCGLIVNELVTNSLKHGFPGDLTGFVEISLHELPDGKRKLVVADNGIGMPENYNERSSRSMGLRLVSDLARQIDGGVSIESNAGTSVSILFEGPSP
jgi:two-component sensor histidine kinase